MIDAATAVLDASALLALLNEETGAEAVGAMAETAAISSVTWCEAFGKLRAAGVPGERLRDDMVETGIAVVPVGSDAAEAAGDLLPRTRTLGLSPADRACLAVARRLGVPAVTEDRVWTTLDLDVDVVGIR